MTRFVALLYSISLNDGARLKMEPFRQFAEGLGLANPRTVLSTGNLIFDSAARSAPKLTAMLEVAFAERFGRRIDIIVRSGKDWQRLAAANPFVDLPDSEASRIGVRVMREPLTAQARAYLASKVTGTEKLVVVDGDPWMHFADKVAGTPLANALGSRRIGAGTMRNLNCVRKIAAAL
ncbi:DUF1697 domain-containing protein [Pelagibacterium lentulum]|uniref:DUF1697 domain-containing protein n=1 Tax=Pelagibacterium lentulum TaxID=2029865 RepID=A0A916RDM7_9HYPH|nr:DUF1697 domain-containing protein [Pelagibacterium lentulum]GGA47411.1 hypothetical protein GCM10011499_16520 [Pelagibacterium lentulum]